jgi:RNA polymerase sigma-70 factor (ECF subfamily)
VALRADDLDPGAVDLDRDRELVLRYQQGDTAAFEELYRRYYPRLHLYCQRRVGDPHASEELAQEAFIRAMRAMPRFAGERRFYPWMTVIAQRLCIDHHRRTSRVEPIAEVDLGVVEEEHAELFGAVDRDHVAEAMQRLAPRHREVLGLREQQGWTYQQIADHLQVPVTTVEALLHRARKALKREFLVVSSGTRLAGFPILGWIVMRMAHIRARVSGHTANELAPVAGTAAAGIAAVTLVLAPFVAPFASSDQRAVTTDAPHVVVASTPATTGAPLVLDPSAPTTTTAAATHDASAGGTSTRTPRANAGPVSVGTGDAAVAAAQQDNAQQPVQVDLHIIQIGANPQQTVEDIVDHLPGGKP